MRKPLGTISLMLLTVGSVDSIRNLPTAALAGSDIVFYFTFSALLFLLPCTIICAWFHRYSDQGIYGWIKTSLGPRAGIASIWFLWLQNALIFPTFFSFIAGALLFSIAPQLTHNKLAIFLLTLSMIWSLSLLNIKGLLLSARFNALCTIAGLMLPFLAIIIIGIYQSLAHPPVLLADTAMHAAKNQSSWSALTAIILSFCGLEIAAVHLKECKKNTFTQAIVFASLLIFITMLFGTLSLSKSITSESINLIAEIPRFFQYFFNKQGYPLMASVVNILIVIGCLTCANNWILAPLKGLYYAINDYKPFSAQKRTPPLKSLLVTQAIVLSLISTAFLLFPAINASYWFLLCLATQMYLLVYALMFIAAIHLSHQRDHPSRLWISAISSIGLIGTGIAFVVSFQPPSELYPGLQSHFPLELAGGLFLLCLPLYLNRYFNDISAH